MADLLRVILSILIPPVGVFFKVGFGMHFWLNILLTIFGYIPGLVHAIWILASNK
ncbi:MAG: YqaE/Pmp3 family membrane protein [Rhodothermales bacterium]|nr:YqaE/Pmp3 family membrane protein [Rhodothermales bacterium]